MRYAILGAGVAGVAAIEAVRSLDPTGEITLISDDPQGFYSRPGLAYYLTGELSDRQLFPRSQDDWKKLNVRYIKGRATRILPAEHQIELGDASFPGLAARVSGITFDRLLIAAGAQALPLTVPGANLEGVVKLDHFQDARGVIKAARKGRTAVVVGGGITALELVEGLVARRVNVHYLLRGDRYWSNVLDEDESRIIEQRLKEDGVQVYYHAEVIEIFGQGRVKGVRLLDGRSLRCDLVAYAIGIRPRADLAVAAGLAVDRGILVNEYLQTGRPDIYAAGDVAQVYDPRTGRSILDSLWGPAREQGHVAGLNMAGQKTAYVKPVAFNVTRLAGLTTTIIGSVGRGRDEDLVGIARGDSETWRALPEALVAQTGFDVNRLRLLVGERTLLGAVVMGDQTLSWPLQKIIAGNADITPIRPRLLTPGVPIGDILAEFWINWRVGHAS